MTTTPSSSRSALQEIRRLTARDRTVLDALAEHQVLTAEHLAQLAFPSQDRAARRAHELSRRGVLARFRRCVRPGSQPWRYALGYVGASIIAAQRGAEAPRPSAHEARLLRLAENPRLGHLLGVNGIFTSLAHHARGGEGRVLVHWYSEKSVTRMCGGLARPDGFGTWTANGRTVRFFLEYDTGTERPMDRLTRKLDGYREVAVGGGPASPVLFWVPSAAREARLWSALGDAPPVPVATASAEFSSASGLSPSERVWCTAPDTPRVGLHEIPQ